MSMTKIQQKVIQFLQEAKNPKVIAYEYGIPTGDARTKGYGNPKEITVLLVDENFKTRNSKHVELNFVGSFRSDYGEIKGNCFQKRKIAKELAEKYTQSLSFFLNLNEK